MALSEASIIALMEAFKQPAGNKVGTCTITGYDAYGNPQTEVFDVYENGGTSSALAFKDMQVTFVPIRRGQPSG